MRLVLSCVHVCDKKRPQTMLYKNLKGKVGREHLLKEGNYCKAIHGACKLLVINLVTKLFEMLLWKCNFISLHDERVCFKWWYFKHIELTPYAVGSLFYSLHIIPAIMGKTY